jgi:hypothetical protein
MPEIVKGPLWLLVRTAVWELLVEFTGNVPKSRLLGDTLAGAMVGTTPAVPTYNPVGPAPVAPKIRFDL